jgi:hypothetical protein
MQSGEASAVGGLSGRPVGRSPPYAAKAYPAEQRAPPPRACARTRSMLPERAETCCALWHVSFLV